jgi:hypothetical protein
MRFAPDAALLHSTLEKRWQLDESSPTDRMVGAGSLRIDVISHLWRYEDSRLARAVRTDRPKHGAPRVRGNRLA